MKDITVAAVQMRVTSLDVEANLHNAERGLEAALKKQPLDLVVFPEDCITGPIPNNAELTLTEDDQAIDWYRQLAKKHQLYIVCGSFITREHGKLFNRSLLLDPEGKTILRYDKHTLWHPERGYLQAGTELPVAETTIGRIGLMNCWDLTDPTICRTLAQKGADIVCCPSYWMDEVSEGLYAKYPQATPDATMIDALCQARAIENEVLFIYANACGKAEIYLNDRTLFLNPVGHSQITAPVLGTLDILAHGHEGVVMATYNLRVSEQAEAQYRFREDMKTSAGRT